MKSKKYLIFLFLFIVGGDLFSGNTTTVNENSNNATTTNINDTTKVTNPNTTDTTKTQTDTKKSLELLAEYMKINHNQTISKFEEDIKTIDRQLAAQGLYGAGEHYKLDVKCSTDNVQSFTNNSIQYIKNLKQTMPIDKTKISELIKYYQNTDLSYYIIFIKNHLQAVGTGDPQSLATNELTNNINNIYALAQLQISAL